MTKREYLLTKLAEECVEIAQRCHKAQIFGLHEKQKGQKLTNSQRIRGELNDLMGIALMCVDEGILEQQSLDDYIRERDAKIAKVKKYMKYSRKLGCLSK